MDRVEIWPRSPGCPICRMIRTSCLRLLIVSLSRCLLNQQGHRCRDHHKFCEGWAPPPTPLHGPAFRNLKSDEKSQLVKLHTNLGHPDPEVLATHLKFQGSPQHIIAGAKRICLRQLYRDKEALSPETHKAS